MSCGEEFIPTENLEIYRNLYVVENGLREFIIDELSLKFGSRWYVTQLPGDILEKFKQAKKFERTIKWTDLIPHHPIYYIDFPDLWKIMLRNDNWNACFKSVFGKQEFVSGTLTQLDFVRNKIAHNRHATQSDVLFVKNTYSMLSKLIGEAKLASFARNSSYAGDILEKLQLLQKLAEQSFEKCSGFAEIPELSLWNSVRSSWWFEESYLGHSVTKISEFFELIRLYSELPRSRGTGHKLEKWILDNKVREAFEQSMREFEVLRQL